MKVLLVANYRNDRQESMLRFADALETALGALGIEVVACRPEPFLGRLKPGARGLAKWLGYIDKFLLFPPRLRRLAANFDVVHILDHSNAFYIPHIADRPHVLTCNDMIAVRSALGEFPENPVGATGRKLQSLILDGVKRARRVACISEATRQDVLRLAGHEPHRVSVVYMGQNYPYRPSALPRPSVKPYVLHVGGGAWYKNRHSVVEMHTELRRRMGGDAPDLWLTGAFDGPPPDGVHCTGRADNQTLEAFYTHAVALVFPSLIEGFGWPIIEAQACGCPVVTTLQQPMTEVAGDAAVFVKDPRNVNALADAVQDVLRMPEEKRKSLRHAGFTNASTFTAERMARCYADIYREVTA